MTKAEYGLVLRWAKKQIFIERFGGKCSICGENDIAVLDFHHLGGKDKDISTNIFFRRMSLIEKELSKCVILCSNCHEEIHCDVDGRHNKSKVDFLKSINLECCSRCSYIGKNLASLSFHHINKDDKRFLISDVINRNRKVSAEELYNELKKCELVCCNCHRKEHANYDEYRKHKTLIDKTSKKHKELHPAMDRNMIYEMHNSGLKNVEIANKLECSRSAISIILKDTNK